MSLPTLPKGNTPLLDALRAHRKGLRFCMPGHKGLGRFRRVFGRAADYDVTELCYSDNLQDPRGVILDSERMTAGVYGANHCLYSVNGSTGSAFCALASVAAPGGEVLLSRDTHKSFFAACEVLGLEPVAAPPERFRELAGKQTVAAVFTTPDYYGCPHEIDWELPVKIVVDGAHGAHVLGPEVTARADFVLLSAHKFLPSLTQSAFLLVKDDADAAACRRARAQFSTTSPSYLLLASLEYGVDFWRRRGRAELDRIARLRAELFAGFDTEPSDPLRLVWNVRGLGRTGFAVEALLNEEELFPEFSDPERVVFFFGLETPRRQLKRLAEAMRRIERASLGKSSAAESAMRRIEHASPGAAGAAMPSKDGSAEAGSPGRETAETCAPEREFVAPVRGRYLAAARGSAEWVPLSACAGRVCARNVGFYPPATALVLCGERFSAAAAARLADRADHVFGTEDNKVLVSREQTQ